MSSNRSLLSPRTTKAALWLGAMALGVGTFIAVTHETIIERETGGADGAILRWITERRAPAVTRFMVDITALGSPTLVAVFTLVTLAILVVLRDRRGAIHLIVASLGTWALTAVTKGVVERARPTEVEHLVEVSGFSYPSGHSLAAAALYLTMAIVAGSHLRTVAAKVVLVAGATALVVMVGISRVYLGVHYPSDVLSGVSLGASWALMLAAAVGILAARRPSV